MQFENQGPVVQSIVRLTSLLMTNSLTVVAKVFSDTFDIFATKTWIAFAKEKATHIFSAKKKKKKKKKNNNNNNKIMNLPYFKIEILSSR